MLILPLTTADTTPPTLGSGAPLKTNMDQITSNFNAIMFAVPFQPCQYPTPRMEVLVGPGIVYDPVLGVTTKVGGVFVGDCNGSTTISNVNDISGLASGQVVIGPGGVRGISGSPSGTNVTLVSAASGTFTQKEWIAYQSTASIATPASGKKRIDLLSIDSDGLVNVTTGTETTGTPSAPALPAGDIPIGTVFLKDTDTVITDKMIRPGRVVEVPSGIPVYKPVSGIITITSTEMFHRCAFDTNSLSTESVNNIVCGVLGQVLFVQTVNDAHDIVLKDASGGGSAALLLGGSDKTLNNAKARATLVGDYNNASLVALQAFAAN